MNRKEWDKAAEAYKQLLTLRPDARQAQSTLAYIYAQQGKITQSIEANLKLAMSAAHNDPNLWEIHKNLALLYQQVGDLQSAIRHAQIAASIAPTDTQPQLQAYAMQLRALIDTPAEPTTPPTK